MQLLKTDARNWTSKYARGGNVRKPSARKMYIVVDALQGHITTNGYVDVVAYTVWFCSGTCVMALCVVLFNKVGGNILLVCSAV